MYDMDLTISEGISILVIYIFKVILKPALVYFLNGDTTEGKHPGPLIF